MAGAVIPISLIQGSAISAMIQAGMDAGVVDQAQGTAMQLLLDPSGAQSSRTVISTSSFYVSTVFHSVRVCDDGSVYHYTNDGSGNVTDSLVQNVPQGQVRDVMPAAFPMPVARISIFANATIPNNHLAGSIAISLSVLTGDLEPN